MDNSVINSMTSALEALEHDSASLVIQALTAIRKSHIRRKNGIQKLQLRNGLPKLLNCIQSDKNDVIVDLAMSILGNCCMDQQCRQLVVHHDGIPKIVKCLRSSKLESIKNRACRALANLALEPKFCSEILEDEDISYDVAQTLLQSKNLECQVTCSRTLRLFADSKSHVNAVLEGDGLKASATLLALESEELISSGLKTVMHLSRNVSDVHARQLVSANGFASLLKLTTHSNESIAHLSESLVFYFIKHECLRPGFGSAGAILIIKEKIQLDEGSGEKQLKWINALCYFCYDAVNRVRLRDAGALKLFMELLQNELYIKIFNRVISALVCFLFDEPSLLILIENDLVGVTLKHIKRIANLPHDVGDLSWLAECVYALKQESDTQHQEEYSSSKVIDDLLLEASGNSDTPKKSNKRQTYSMYSPTYKAQNDWNFEAYSKGPKNIMHRSASTSNISYGIPSPSGSQGRYSPPLFYPNSPESSDYSPLSVSSEWSPTSSPSVSPTHNYVSTEPSPSVSTRGLSPPNSDISLDSNLEQAQLSPVSSSADMSPFQIEAFSSEEATFSATSSDYDSDDFIEVKDELIPGKRKVKGSTSSTQCKKRLLEDDKGCISTQDSDQSCKFLNNKGKKKPKTSIELTEHYLFTILSRISHMDDFCHLINSQKCWITYVEYLRISKNPSDRCFKLMKRLSQNPKSFEAIVLNLVPSILTWGLQHISGELESVKRNILMNLSVILSSDYGKGTLDHLLLSKDDTVCVKSSLAPLHIYSNDASLSEYLRNRSCLDFIFESFQKEYYGDLKHFIIGAFATLLQRKINVNLSNEFTQKLSRESLSADTECNLSLILEDGQVIQTNRQKLAASSPVFSAMLEGSFVESSKSEIKILCRSSEAFRLFIKLLDLNAAPLRDAHMKTLLNLLEITDIYDVPAIQHLVTMQILESMEKKDAANIIESSKAHRCYKLGLCSLIKFAMRSPSFLDWQKVFKVGIGDDILNLLKTLL